MFSCSLFPKYDFFYLESVVWRTLHETVEERVVPEEGQFLLVLQVALAFVVAVLKWSFLLQHQSKLWSWNYLPSIFSRPRGCIWAKRRRTTPFPVGWRSRIRQSRAELRVCGEGTKIRLGFCMWNVYPYLSAGDTYNPNITKKHIKLITSIFLSFK